MLGITTKDVLDWTVPVLLTSITSSIMWAGSLIRRYLGSLEQQVCEAKKSVISLNKTVSEILLRLASVQRDRERDNQEFDRRLSAVERHIERIL